MALAVLPMELGRLRSVISEALRLQEVEEANAFATANPALDAASQAGSESLLQALRYLRDGNVQERQLHARLLSVANMPESRRLTDLLHALAEESDAKVIRWLVFGLRNTASASAVDRLLQLARHPSPEVRFPVPDALSACAENFDVIADALLDLSRDEDADVRWSAAFELAAWWTDAKDPRIRYRFWEISTADPSNEIREVAREALRGGS